MDVLREVQLQKLRSFILTEIRKRDMSVRQFSEFVGVAHSTVNRILDENDQSTPTLESLLKIADATNTDLYALLGLTFPDIVQRTALSPDARIIAQRVEQAPEHIREAIRALLLIVR